MLRTNRGLAKFIFLSLITFGIYGLVVMCHISEEINQVASRRDGKHTMHFALIFFLLSAVTLGIATLVWFHKLSNRMGEELQARGIEYNFSAGTFWGWYFFGALILIGPFIYFYKFFKSMNLINADFNEKLNAPAPAAAPAPVAAPVVEAPAAPVVEAPAAPVIEVPAEPVVEVPAEPASSPVEE